MDNAGGAQLQGAPKRVPSVPLMKTATINITISPRNSINASQNGYPLQRNSSRSSCNGDSLDLNSSMGRISLRSEGSQMSFVSGSRTPSRSASIRSHQSTPPVTPGDSYPVNGHPLNGKGGDGDSAMGSSPEDKISERSFGSNQNGFEMGGESLKLNNGSRDPEHSIVAMYMDREVVAVIKVICQSESVFSNEEFLSIMSKLSNTCGLHMRKNDEETELTNVFVNKVKMADDRPAKEHLSELSRSLGSSITICDVRMWRTTDGWTHVAPFVDQVVKSEGRCTLARACTVLTLRKTSKYAPVEEFAKQICDQITAKKPDVLGNKEKALELQKLKTHNHVSKKDKNRETELLTQTYLFDSTINVAEAARRSFVDIVEFQVY